MIPDSDTFRTWARASIEKLGMRQSQFLRFGTPGDKNRAARALAAKEIKLDTARALVKEIQLAAKEKDVVLPGLPISCCRQKDTKGASR